MAWWVKDLALLQVLPMFWPMFNFCLGTIICCGGSQKVKKKKKDYMLGGKRPMYKEPTNVRTK